MKMNHGFWCLEYDIDQIPDCVDARAYFHTELCYDMPKKLWVPRDEYSGAWYPGCFPCRSYRAAKRHLKKHNEIPNGTRFRLVSKYVGGDRYLTKKQRCFTL